MVLLTLKPLMFCIFNNLLRHCLNIWLKCYFQVYDLMDCHPSIAWASSVWMQTRIPNTVDCKNSAVFLSKTVGICSGRARCVITISVQEVRDLTLIKRSSCLTSSLAFLCGSLSLHIDIVKDGRRQLIVL